MFAPSDLNVRPLKSEDVEEVSNLIKHVRSEELDKEWRPQIKQMSSNPLIWTLTGFIICAFGISAELHPLLASAIVLPMAIICGCWYFQNYWFQISRIFTNLGDDLKDLKKFYIHHQEGEKRIFLVVEHRSRVVGSAAVIPVGAEEPNVCKLFRVFVHPATRRMGVATMIVKEALTQAKKAGYTKVIVRTHKTNVASVGFYESLDFVKVSEQVFVSAFPLKYWVVNFEKSL